VASNPWISPGALRPILCQSAGSIWPSGPRPAR
jgi:hypothetical protein